MINSALVNSSHAQVPNTVEIKGSESYNCVLDKYKPVEANSYIRPTVYCDEILHFTKAFQHNSTGRKELSLSWVLPVSLHAPLVFLLCLS